ncbi:MAG: hypothetical protein GX620_06255 [Chloroflexi bacterium]|nr:hypothetical protein [Chloroflexota bacterium]
MICSIWVYSQIWVITRLCCWGETPDRFVGVGAGGARAVAADDPRYAPCCYWRLGAACEGGHSWRKSADGNPGGANRGWVALALVN